MCKIARSKEEKISKCDFNYAQSAIQGLLIPLTGIQRRMPQCNKRQQVAHMSAQNHNHSHYKDLTVQKLFNIFDSQIMFQSQASGVKHLGPTELRFFLFIIHILAINPIIIQSVAVKGTIQTPSQQASSSQTHTFYRMQFLLCSLNVPIYTRSSLKVLFVVFLSTSPLM